MEIIELDVTDPKTIEKSFEIVKGKIENLDLLINNAAILGDKIHDSMLNLTVSDFTNLFNVNVCGVFSVTNTFLPLLKRKDSKPVVLNISSDMSSISLVPQLKPGHIPYKVSKCALNMLNKNYALEFGDQCTFICMHPGWLDTGKFFFFFLE